MCDADVGNVHNEGVLLEMASLHSMILVTSFVNF